MNLYLLKGQFFCFQAPDGRWTGNWSSMRDAIKGGVIQKMFTVRDYVKEGEELKFLAPYVMLQWEKDDA